MSFSKHYSYFSYFTEYPVLLYFICTWRLLFWLKMANPKKGPHVESWAVNSGILFNQCIGFRKSEAWVLWKNILSSVSWRSRTTWHQFQKVSCKMKTNPDCRLTVAIPSLTGCFLPCCASPSLRHQLDESYFSSPGQMCLLQEHHDFVTTIS